MSDFYYDGGEILCRHCGEARLAAGRFPVQDYSLEAPRVGQRQRCADCGTGFLYHDTGAGTRVWIPVLGEQKDA